MKLILKETWAKRPMDTMHGVRENIYYKYHKIIKIDLRELFWSEKIRFILGFYCDDKNIFL